MGKKEIKTDLWVIDGLKECNIKFDAQGSNVPEIDLALKNASKRGTGKAGYPEFVAVVDDFVIVIEDKAEMNRHVKNNSNGILDTSLSAVRDYAINGAYFYAKHITQNSGFRKAFAIGVSGDERHHRITPVWVDDREGYEILPDVESFISFNAANIREYYTRNVLKEPTDVEKTFEEILKDAAELHEYLRTYGSLSEQEKPLVVAGIMLALDEREMGNFSLDSLKGDSTNGARDGDKIINAINGRLTRSNVGPDAKKDKLMSQFSFIQTSYPLNKYNDDLKKTPLKFFAEFLDSRIFKIIKYRKSSEDYIGRFYGEFVKYSGGDGQLGIVLTPRHITDLMCDLIDVKPDDVVLDPCCGTGGFLISAMHRMLSGTDSASRRLEIKKKQLHGFEQQAFMFAIAVSNMILRDDGNSNLECCNFFDKDSSKVQMKGATVGLMNPPYSQGSKITPGQYEICFVEHLLECLTIGARAAVIVPQSTMTGKTSIEKNVRNSLLKKHSLEGVITCNNDTFYNVGVNPVIAIFTAGIPHDPKKECRFIDFRNDGFYVRAHVGLVEGNNAKDLKEHLLDVWNDKIDAPSKFCVKTTIEDSDEWLHSFYYFNDEIPTDADFDKVIGDYLTFEFNMIVQGREYLFRRDVE